MTLQYIVNEFQQICFALQSFSEDFKNNKTVDSKFIKNFDDLVTSCEFLRNIILAESNNEVDEQDLYIENRLRDIEQRIGILND